MNILYLDPGIAAAVDCVSEQNAAIQQAIRERRQLTDIDCAALSGAVSALLDAIDARLPKHAEPVMRVAA